MIRKTNIVTGKKAYIIPHASIREELRCGAMCQASPCTVEPEEMENGGGDVDPVKRRNFNFYSPYSDDNNW